MAKPPHHDLYSLGHPPPARPDLIVAAYIAYFVCSVFITWWVGRSLHTNGRLFLVEAFHQDTALADSVNHLLLVGFYLINIGAMLLGATTPAMGPISGLSRATTTNSGRKRRSPRATSGKGKGKGKKKH